MRRSAVILAAALVIAPPGAEAADFVVWWFKGFYEREDAAVREIIAAFEQETGEQVELVQPAMDEMFEQANAALEAGAARLAFPLLSTSDCLESRSPGPQQA